MTVDRLLRPGVRAKRRVLGLRSFLLFLGGAVAAGDVGLIGGFFNVFRNGFADAFVED